MGGVGRWFTDTELVELWLARAPAGDRAAVRVRDEDGEVVWVVSQARWPEAIFHTQHEAERYIRLVEADDAGPG